MSSIGALDKWISLRTKQGGNQTNLIYFTGHGGKADKKTPHNTTAFLWNNSRLKVSDFVKKLDKLPKDQPCLLVMVQCYSGGFANVIFKEGNPEKGLSDYPRAGFFATVKDRVAAGASIRKRTIMNTARFWEGLCGESRVGNKTQNQTLTKTVKLHSPKLTPMVLRSTPIDIPIKTSDDSLRHFSAYPPRNRKKQTRTKQFKSSQTSSAESQRQGNKQTDGPMRPK